jgi:hypothetical protein
LEPTSPTATQISDIIRFNPQQSALGSVGTLVFYSDNTDATRDLGDTGFPTLLYTNALNKVEVGPEGNNGFTYTPTLGQPGFEEDANATVTYIIKSDVVPAPPAVVLAGLGAGCVALRRYVGRRATA